LSHATSGPSTEKISALETLLIVCVFVAAVFLRVWRLGEVPGVNGDEAWMAVQAQRAVSGGQFLWLTPTGNLLNPFLFLPHLILAALFPPSFMVLRIPSVVAGVMGIAVNWYLGEKVFGRRVAIVVSALLASLPISVAYSRLSWDASESILFTLPLAYLPLLKIQRATLRQFAFEIVFLPICAFIVHPSNIFLLPFILWRAGQLVGFPDRVRFLSRYRLDLTFFSVVAVVILVCGIEQASGYWDFAFALNELYSGVTVFNYIPGAFLPGSFVILPAHFFRFALNSIPIVFLLILALAVISACRQREMTLPVYSGCFLTALFCFYCVSGAAGLHPGVERYGIFVIAPGIVLLGLALVALCSSEAVSRRPLEYGVLVLSLFYQLSFYRCYLKLFELSGGNSALTYRTAAEEPKLTAYRAISSKLDSECVRITEWWNYWPIKYLSFPRHFESVKGDVDPRGSKGHTDCRYRIGFLRGKESETTIPRNCTPVKPAILSGDEPLIGIFDCGVASEKQGS
jgi:hypothetical protein